jgi:hypothetical protein
MAAYSYAQASEVIAPSMPAAEPQAPRVDGTIEAAPAAYHSGYSYLRDYSTFDSGGGYANGVCGETCRGDGCLQGCRTDCCNGCRRWFGGVYGLLMERDDSSQMPVAFTTTNGTGWYPEDWEIAMTTADSDVGYQGGLEIRFGAYFGGHRACQSCDGQSCDGQSCGCGPTRAWEFVYWGLYEESNTATMTDVTWDANRTHSMINFDGLEYDPGGGARSVYVFYDTGVPTVDNSTPYDVEVRTLSARSTFQMQNVELNLLRLPMLNACCSRYEMTTFLGTRIIRIDDDFRFASSFERMDTNWIGSMAYNLETDNTLYGVQIGSNGSYHCGCSGKFALHCNTAFGLYGNHIEVAHRMAGATYASDGSPAVVETDEDDVAVVGELRAGASYRPHCNWRLYAGWRVVGISGVARATDQMPTQFNTPGQVGTIKSDGAMLVHGLQTGMEFSY